VAEQGAEIFGGGGTGSWSKCPMLNKLNIKKPQLFAEKGGKRQ
jgi:hypothetical protein